MGKYKFSFKRTETFFSKCRIGTEIWFLMDFPGDCLFAEYETILKLLPMNSSLLLLEKHYA